MSKNEYTPSNKEIQWNLAAIGVRRLYCGMHPDHKRVRLMSVFQAFIDDSGDESAYVLGGLIAPVDIWDQFSIDWVKILKGDPSIEYYRSNEAIARKECFQNFGLDERDQKIAKLASSIPKQSCLGLSAYLSTPDFNQIKDTYAPIFKKVPFPYRFPFEEPYFLAASCMIPLVVRNCISFFPKLVTKTSQVEFVFDEQGKIGKRFRSFYEEYLKRQSPMLGYCEHRNDKGFPPLQAADMIASWIRRGVSSRISMWSASDIYLSNIPNITIEISKDIFIRFLERLISDFEEIEQMAKGYILHAIDII